MAHLVVQGSLRVRLASTVICARQRTSNTQNSVLRKSEFLNNSGFLDLDGFFGDREEVHFKGGWEVLLGQSEVCNFLKPRREDGHFEPMRYGGEWKLAGGHIDPGESPSEAAVRELCEEFLVPKLSKEEIRGLHPFTVTQTRPLNSRSNIMYNFIALEDDNEWLRKLDVDDVNAKLRQKREAFMRMNHKEELHYRNLERIERAKHAPEVYQLAWMPIVEAIRHCLNSMVVGRYVNEFQRTSFEHIGRVMRDPMFITATIILQLESFPGPEDIHKHAMTVTLDERQEQWLFDGMTQDDVQRLLLDRMISRKQSSKKGRVGIVLEKRDLRQRQRGLLATQNGRIADNNNSVDRPLSKL